MLPVDAAAAAPVPTTANITLAAKMLTEITAGSDAAKEVGAALIDGAGIALKSDIHQLTGALILIAVVASVAYGGIDKKLDELIKLFAS